MRVVHSRRERRRLERLVARARLGWRDRGDQAPSTRLKPGVGSWGPGLLRWIQQVRRIVDQIDPGDRGRIFFSERRASCRSRHHRGASRRHIITRDSRPSAAQSFLPRTESSLIMAMMNRSAVFGVVVVNHRYAVQGRQRSIYQSRVERSHAALVGRGLVLRRLLVAKRPVHVTQPRAIVGAIRCVVVQMEITWSPLGSFGSWPLPSASPAWSRPRSPAPASARQPCSAGLAWRWRRLPGFGPPTTRRVQPAPSR